MASSEVKTTSTAGWRPKAIIFDLLTALLDSWSLWDASTPSGTSAEGRPWRSRYLDLTFGCGAYVPYEDLIRQAAQDVGLPESAPATLIRNFDQIRPWPGATRVLARLQEQGLHLGVATNCSRGLGHAAAQSLNIAFDAVITAEESGFYKPTKEAYQAVLNAMSVEASEVLFVAGSAGDVEGATRSGMEVVWHNHVGLAKKGSAVPLREGGTLEDALKDFL